MHIETTGTARIKHKETGEIFEIEADELDWQSVGGSERQMGPETEYEAALSHNELGDLTWSLWEYPAGAENYQSNRLNGHELLENFEISLEHDPEDSYDPSDYGGDKLYYAEDDPNGLTPGELRSKGAEDQVNYLAWWFLSFHEDPSLETPYNGREGGFLYIHGGPFDARTEIEQEFHSFISQAVIDQAVEEVEAEGILEWAPAHNHPDRIDDEPDLDDRPDAFDEGDALDRAMAALSAGRQPQYGSPAELALRIQIKEAFDRLEEELPPERPVHGGLGHNMPPVDERFTAAEIAEIRQSIITVRTELEKSTPDAVEVVKAAGAMKEIAFHAGRISGQAVEEFAKGLGKGAGEEIGKGVGKLVVWGAVGLALVILNAVHPIMSWLPSILP